MGLESECTLSQSDWEFVKKLTRLAHVHVLSSQVSIKFDRSAKFELGTEQNKLNFPINWSLEYIGTQPSRDEEHPIVCMTWEILPIKKIS